MQDVQIRLAGLWAALMLTYLAGLLRPRNRVGSAAVTESRPAPAGPGKLLLGLSAIGSPLTQLAIRRLGRWGAVAVECVCAGLLVRDATLIALGAPRRLRRGPAALLWLELGSALTATILCVPLLSGPDALARACEPRARGAEAARRAAISALFGLHTLRFHIYLQPDHGLLAARSGESADERGIRNGNG